MNDNEVERDVERGPYVLPRPDVLANTFTEREALLIGNCRLYAANNPSGLPGHNLMIIISKLCNLYSLRGTDILEALKAKDAQQ